jgi:hypothetical protein
MRNYLIRAALTFALDKTGASSDEIERYEARTRNLRDADTYPCPVCFVRGEEQPLVLRLSGDWVDQAACPKCKGRWSVPVPRP